MNVAAFAEPREPVFRPSSESSASTDITDRTADSDTATSGRAGRDGAEAQAAHAAADTIESSPAMCLVYVEFAILTSYFPSFELDLAARATTIAPRR